MPRSERSRHDAREESSMTEVLADDPELLEWAKRYLDDEDLAGFTRIVGWAQERGLTVLIGGDVVFAFSNLPSTMGWLTISAFDRVVIVTFARLKRFAPFVGDARARLMKDMRLSGFSFHEDGRDYGKALLSELADEYPWQIFKGGIDRIANLAGGRHREVARPVD
jgi:hypothetical protein